MDRTGNLFIIEDDYQSIKTKESGAKSKIETVEHNNIKKERDERNSQCLTVSNKNERHRVSYPAAIQTRKLHDVGINNVINNKTKLDAKSNREQSESETNRRTPYKTDTAASENDRTFELEEANRKRSGNLFIVEINNDITNETNSTKTPEKQKSTIITNRAASEGENRKEEKTRETCNIFVTNANTDNQESCKSADVNGERNGKGFIIKPTNYGANSIDVSQKEKKHVKQDLETCTIPVINLNTNNHESCKVEDVNKARHEIDIMTRTNFSTDNIIHTNVNSDHQVCQREDENGKRDGNVLITDIHSSIDDSANSKKEDITKDANASKKEDIMKDANASKKEDITKDANASKKEDITKDANASKKENITKDANASKKEASVEDGHGVLQFDAGQTQEKDVRKENLQLLTEIAELCNRPDRQRVENIFLLGKPGAGKSALVNTIIKALAGSYIPKASVGAGVRQSKTLTLDNYKSCGVTKEDIKDPQHRKLVEDILPKLPTIFDAAGRNDPKSYANPEGVEEILELFIGGFIPPGTSIEFLETKQKEHDVGCLRDVLFTESKPEWKATKIVFVQSCRDSLPVDLIQCLDRILRKTDPKTAQLKYTGEVFVVITKYDLVVDQKQMTDLDPSTENISMQDFLTLENTVAEQFSIKGELDLNVIRWVSYGGKRSFDDPNIDNIALKFIKRMLAPGNTPAESTTVPVVMTPEKLKKLEAQKSPKESPKDLGFDASHIKLVVIVILFAFFLEFVKTLLSAKLE